MELAALLAWRDERRDRPLLDDVLPAVRVALCASRATSRPPQPKGARRGGCVDVGAVRALVPGDPQCRRTRRTRLSRCGRWRARDASRAFDARTVDTK